MDSLQFSLQATMPVFFLIVLGYVLKRLGILTAAFCQTGDKLVFHVALPILLFLDLSATDLSQNFHFGYLLFCAGVTTVSFFGLWFLARHRLSDRSLVGEFVQVSFRSSAAILGYAIIKSVYGSVGVASLMILGSVPLFNFYAVLVLTVEGPKAKAQPLPKKLLSALQSAAMNPIIWGILLGLLSSVLGLHSYPPIVTKTMENLGGLATPLALLSIGAGFRGTEALENVRLSGLAAGIKLLLLPAIFLPLAVMLNFEGEKLLALLLMLGSTSTPTCYIMARNLGHEGKLSISVIVLTTLLSAFTLTFWIFFFRSLGYLA